MNDVQNVIGLNNMLQFCSFLRKLAEANTRNVFIVMVSMKTEIVGEWKTELNKMSDVVLRVTDSPWIKCTQNFRAMPCASGSSYIRNFEPNLIVFCKKPSFSPGDAKECMNRFFPFTSCPWLDFTERFSMHKMRLTAKEIPYVEAKLKIPWRQELDANRSEKSLAYGQVFVSSMFPYVSLCFLYVMSQLNDVMICKQGTLINGDEDGDMLEICGGVAGATRGFALTGKNIIFCEKNEQQMGYSIDRLSKWSMEIALHWGSDIVAPMQAMLVHKDDLADYGLNPDAPTIRFVVNPRMFDPVSSEDQKDYDRLYGGCSALLVCILSFIT